MEVFRGQLDKIIIQKISNEDFFGIGHRIGALPDGTPCAYRVQLYFHHHHLPEHLACYALFTYATRATVSWLESVKHEPILPEEQMWPDRPKFRRMFENVLSQYGVKEEEILKFWNDVDGQFDVLGRAKLPDEERYRFDRVPEMRVVN